MVVVVILALLIALLLPALNSSIRTARATAVGAEINQLAQALASFKSKYGDYPPSRILLIENGDYSAAIANATSVSNANGDITIAQLAQRSLTYLRKFFPRAIFSTSGTPVFSTGGTRWYDFNGNGIFDTTAYVLDGHQCLVFFLGGIPNPAIASDGTIDPNTTSMTGFGKDPTNPFSNNISSDPRLAQVNGVYPPNPMYSANRTAPLFEFNPGRLYLAFPDPNPRYGTNTAVFPGYLDSFGNAKTTNNPGDLTNFYAYFSSYGNNGYDPNDVSFSSELDANQQDAGLAYKVSFPVVGGACGSLAPNPYTSTLTVPTSGTVTFLNPQSFQIISSGIDGLYGLGGQYTPDAGTALPLDSAHYLNTSDTNIRTRENDNLSNFHNGRLQ
jgi:general secretion pathway protein G